jgi:tetratricopeptide (TPR) repeat protein
MSIRKRVVTRWALPGISLVIACVCLTIFFIKRDSVRHQPPVSTAAETESRKPPIATGSNQPLLSSASTNQTGAEAGEDRVVALVNEGNQLLAQRDYAKAVQKYEQAVAIEPGDENLHYNLAIALARLGKIEEAKKHYEEALQIFPEHGEARNNLGNLLMRENKLSEAIDQFREAVKIVPGNASFHNNLGTAYGRQGKVPEAIMEFAEAVKLTPTYVEARVNLANASLTAGKVDEAVTQLNEALRLQPDFQPAMQAMRRVRQIQSSSSVPK